MKYPYTLYRAKVEDHVFWAAECPSLKGCVGQGETPQEALEALELSEEEWLETAKEYGFDIPEVPVEELEIYSGKFTVRVASNVHKQAAELAKKQGISLNQYVNDAIVTQNTALTTSKQLMPYVADMVEQIQWLVSSAVSENRNISRSRLFAQAEKEADKNVLYRSKQAPAFA